MESTAEPCSRTDDLARLERTVGRHIHDVRNCINSLDLEAALLSELVTHPEALESIRRMRWQTGQLEAITRSLSIRIAGVQRVSLTAMDLLTLWKGHVATLEDSSRPFEWTAPAESTRIELDAIAITSVLRELMAEALRHSEGRRIQASVRTTDHQVIAEVKVNGENPSIAREWIEDLSSIVARSGGKLRHRVLAATGEWIAALEFPAAPD